MHSWLVDNFELIVIALSITAVVFGFIWWRTRNRRAALVAGAAVASVGLVWLLIQILPLVFGKSDSQQIESKIREMAAAVKDANLERIFSHISNDFRYRGHDKAAFRQRAADVLRSRHVEDVIVWDFERGEVARATRKGKISFMVKARGNWQGSDAGYLCEAEFVLDPDNQWRMKGFEIFNPFRESTQPIPLPGF